MGTSGAITSEGVMTGDFNKVYHLESKGNISGSTIPDMNGPSTTTIDATWSGPCPADQKPGDMVLPDGTKINVMSMSRATALPPR